MIGWAILIFMVGFNAAVPVGVGMVHNLGAPNTLPYNTAYNATFIQQNIAPGCNNINQTSTITNGCKPITPSPSIVSQLVSGFGDWIDAMGYLGAAIGGMLLPYWYLTNDFGLSPTFAAVINGLVWISYTSVILYYFAFRNPES